MKIPSVESWQDGWVKCQSWNLSYLAYPFVCVPATCIDHILKVLITKEAASLFVYLTCSKLRKHCVCICLYCHQEDRTNGGATFFHYSKRVHLVSRLSGSAFLAGRASPLGQPAYQRLHAGIIAAAANPWPTGSTLGRFRCKYSFFLLSNRVNSKARKMIRLYNLLSVYSTKMCGCILASHGLNVARDECLPGGK